MTPEEYQNSLNNRFALELKAMEDAFLATVKDAVGNMGVRIFEEGKDSSGGEIGIYEYSGKNKNGKSVGIYVPDNKSPRKGNHRGKPNEEGKSKKITTTYYQSYQSFREQQGREASFVNLRLFGRLMSDFFNAPVSDRVPAEANPIMVDGFQYYTRVRDENTGKMKGAESKYGRIFAHTKEERERFNRTLNFELNKRLKSLNA